MSVKQTPQKPPAGLSRAGKALWKAIMADLGDGWRLDAREVELLGRACSSADVIVELEKAIKRDGVMSIGSAGQPVVNPAVSEVRQLKLAQARLLSVLELVDPKLAERHATPASARGRKAAQARWQQDEKRRVA